MFDDLCRLCSRPHYENDTSNIFSTTGKSLAFMIKECTNLNIDINDKLPDKICKQCNEKLDVSYAFRRQCEYVDQKFRQGLIFPNHEQTIKNEFEIIEYEPPVTQNKIIENVSQLSSIKTEAITVSEDEFCPKQNPEIGQFTDNTSANKKVKIKVKTINKCKTKKISSNNPTKSTFKDNNEKKEHNEGDVQIHMCYLCGALVKRIHSHMKAHRDAGKPKLKKYRCEKCGAAFSRLNNLNIHLKTHLDVKPLKCTLCDKRFIIKRYLDRHMIVHTGDRPWKCQFCSKAFQTKYNLNTHVRVHTREKPFKCPFCELCFRQRAALNIHVRTHNAVPNTCT